MAYRMTPRRARALKKAQEISARKRRKRFGFTSDRKLSKSQKRVIGVVAAGAVIAGGVYGTNAWMNMEQRKAKIKAMKNYRDKARWNVNARRLTRSPDMTTSKFKKRYKDEWTEKIITLETLEGAVSTPSKVVRATRGVKVTTRVTGIAADIMRELDGTQIPGRRKGAKYKVIFNN